MKTFSTILIAFVFCIVSLPDAVAQQWTVYEADVDPGAFDPAFEVTQQGGEFTNAVVDDPDRAENKLLHMTTTDNADGTNDNNQWRQQLGGATAVTVVFRAKGNDETKPLLFDADFDFNGLRSAVRIQPDGNFSIANGTADGTPDPLTVNTQEWNIYRYTRDNDGFALYVNEDPTPVLTGTSVAAGSNSYFRFGDGWGSSGGQGMTIDTYFDWVVWDASGAYSPEESALPSHLTTTPLGDWVMYNADVEPGAFDPAFEVTQQSGTFTNEIVDDPTRVGNKLLHMTTTDVSDNNQWRQPTSATDLTIVVRAKSVDTGGKNLLFDMDIRNSTAGRFSLRVLTDGTYSIASGGSGSDVLGHDASKWTIYRFTKSGQDVAVYLDENPTPVFTATSESTSDGSDYFRFGDGWGSGNIDTQIDWVVWDASGAYSPEQTRLPNDLLNPPTGDWTVYEADVEPLTFDPAFEVTQQSGDFSNQIIVDPDDASNNLLHMSTTAVGDNNQWRQPTTATDLTIVIKAKSVDTGGKNLLFDMDMRNSTAGRFSLRVLTDGTYSIASGGSGSDVLGHDASAWTIYRFTKSGQDVAVYLDENPTPVFTATSESTSDGSDYFRFGDGWGSGNIDTQVDWVVWDVSGAYSPEQTRLPDHLTGAIVDDIAPTISTAGSLAALNQDLGFSDDNTVTSYTVSGSDLEGDITITPPANFEVSLNETDWFTAENPLVLAHTDGTVEETTIYVRLNAVEVGEYSGDISHTSEGAEEQLVAVSGATVDLVPAIMLTEDLEGFIKNLSSPVSSQNYRVSGENLKGAITVTAPSDFEISVDDETWVSEIVIDAEDRSVTNRIIYVRLSAATLGSYSGEISHTATDAADVNLAVSGEVIPDPGITVTGELSPFSQGLGTPSAPQTYTLAGANLAGNIEISLPEGFEISFNGNVWLESLSLAPVDGNVAEMTLHVRLNASAEGNSEGSIVHSSPGVDAASLAVSGTTGPGLVTSLGDTGMNFNLWPNPSSDRIILERGSASSMAQLTIHSLSGKIVSSNRFEPGNLNLEIDIDTLPQGVYLLEYTDDKRNEILRFIKE